MGAESMSSGDVLAGVGVSDGMSDDVRFPQPAKTQVSARVEREVVKKLDHYTALLKAFAKATGRDEEVIEAIERSHSAREALAAGIDVLLDKFGGWPETQEGRDAQLAEVLKGTRKPK